MHEIYFLVPCDHFASIVATLSLVQLLCWTLLDFFGGFQADLALGSSIALRACWQSNALPFDFELLQAQKRPFLNLTLIGLKIGRLGQLLKTISI